MEPPTAAELLLREVERLEREVLARDAQIQAQAGVIVALALRVHGPQPAAPVPVSRGTTASAFFPTNRDGSPGRNVAHPDGGVIAEEPDQRQLGPAAIRNLPPLPPDRGVVDADAQLQKWFKEPIAGKPE